MEIKEYFLCQEKEKYLNQIKEYDWSAAKFLVNLLEENRLQEVLGGWCKLFILIDDGELISFITLSAKDCISTTETPWLGFFHTAPEHRRKGYGKLLIEYACDHARSEGFKSVFLATDHIGLYEKYGFKYLENRIDVWGEDSRIYKKEL